MLARPDADILFCMLERSVHAGAIMGRSKARQRRDLGMKWQELLLHCRRIPCVWISEKPLHMDFWLCLRQLWAALVWCLFYGDVDSPHVLFRGSCLCPLGLSMYLSWHCAISSNPRIWGSETLLLSPTVWLQQCDWETALQRSVSTYLISSLYAKSSHRAVSCLSAVALLWVESRECLGDLLR